MGTRQGEFETTESEHVRSLNSGEFYRAMFPGDKPLERFKEVELIESKQDDDTTKTTRPAT